MLTETISAKHWSDGWVYEQANLESTTAMTHLHSLH